MSLENKVTKVVKNLESKVGDWFDALDKKPLKTGVKTVVVLYLAIYLLNWLRKEDN